MNIVLDSTSRHAGLLQKFQSVMVGCVLIFSARRAEAQQTPCTVFALPVVAGFGTPSPNGLSEWDTVNDVYYLAGGCSAYPLIFQRGIPALSGGAWTATLPRFPIGEAVPGPVSAPAVALPPFPIANAAAYADGQGAALTGNAVAPFCVRVGYTPIHLQFGLRYLATSWVWNGIGYTANNLDPGAVFASSRAYAVVQRDDGSLVAGGSGAVLGTRGLTAEQPVYWLLAPATGASAGPVTSGAANGLAALATGRDAFVYAVSPRTDAGTTLTFVGASGGTLSGISSTWATFWRVTPPVAGGMVAPVNLNGVAGLAAPARANTGNPNAGGAAYGVTVDGGDDYVVGTVQRFSRVGRGFSLVNQACVWASAAGGAFTPTLLNFAAVGNSRDSIARGVSIVNGVPTVVGEVRSTDDGKWHGFIATLEAGTWTVNRVTADINSTGWTIYAIKAVNSQGVMIGTAGRTRGGSTQRVILFPNGVQLDPPPPAPLNN